MHPTDPPVTLPYATFSAGVVSWQRDRDLVHITIHEPRARYKNLLWKNILAFYAIVTVATLIAARVLGGTANDALFVIGIIIFMHVVGVLAGLASLPRKLLIRVSATKLLIDEYHPRRLGATDQNGVKASLRGRSYAADEITSVTASNSTLKVKTKTRRLAPFSATGYDPGDLAFAADAITKILAQGVDAWSASQERKQQGGAP